MGKVFFIFYYGFVFFLTIHFVVCLGDGMKGLGWGWMFMQRNATQRTAGVIFQIT